MRSRCDVYIPNKSNYKRLDDWFASGEPALVVSGPSGMGKSALIANWLTERKDALGKVIYHFVGNGGLEGSYEAIAQRLCREIRDLYSLGESTEELKEMNPEEQLNDLAIQIDGKEPLLIVLDDINQLADTDNAKLLNWLPAPTRNVRFLFSTLEDDVTMEVFTHRNYSQFILKSLGVEERRQFVTEYLKRLSKKLPDELITRIIKDKESENTLVLKSLLNEFANFGSHERLSERLDYYLSADTIEDFFQRILSRYEDDYGKDVVSRILSLIVFSRNGISEQELLDITEYKQLDWSCIYCAMSMHLTVKSGLVAFSHQYMRNAAIARYAKLGSNARAEIIRYFGRRKDARACDELPYQYYAIKDHKSLHKYIVDFDVFDYINTKDIFGLAKYWRYLIENGAYSLEDYLSLSAKKDTNTAISYHNIGYFIHNYFTLIDLSLKYYLKSLKIDKTIFGEKHPDVAISYNNIGTIYFNQGDYAKALEYCLKSLEIQKTLFEENQPDIATSYNNIGQIYSDQGEYEKALEYHLKALEIQKTSFGENHPDVADSYNNIGKIYHEKGEYEKALEYHFKALDIRKSLFGENHPDVAGSYNNIGNIYYIEQGDYDRALKYHFKALDIHKFLFGENHPNVATSYNNIGQIYSSQEEYEKALEYHSKALDIRKSLLGENHPDVATSYNNIGSIYAKQGNYAKALDYYFKSLEISKTVFGENHPDVATLYNNIGYIYSGQEEYEKALEYHSKALDIRKTVFGENHPDIATSYNNIGSIYSEQGDNAKALEYHLKSLKILKSLLGNNHNGTIISYEWVTDTLNSIIIQNLQIEDYKKALEYSNQLLKLQTEFLGKNSIEVAQLLNTQGDIYSNLEDGQKKLKCYLNAASIYDRNNEEDETLAWICYNLGWTYDSDFNNPSKSLPYHQRALDIRKRLLGEDNEDTISSYINTAYQMKELGRYAKALEYFKIGLQWRVKNFGEKAQKTRNVYRYISECYDELGDEAKAAKYNALAED